MPKSLTNQQAYDRCKADGMFIPIKEKDYARIQTMLNLVDEDLKTINELKLKNDRWNTLFKLNYDVLHTLVESYLLHENIKSQNHQCLFSYICLKHPELELNWEFFERLRTKRNGIHYYGESIDKEGWKKIELQVSLYINLLKIEIKKKMPK